MILQIDSRFPEKEMYVDDRLIHFAMMMQKELDANEQTKGSIFNWNIENDFPKWLYEFEYHKSKLIAALMAKDKDQTVEYISDLGNYLVCLLFSPQIKIQKSFTLTKSEIKII